jgi:hypothetical protein
MSVQQEMHLSGHTDASKVAIQPNPEDAVHEFATACSAEVTSLKSRWGHG